MPEAQASLQPAWPEKPPYCAGPLSSAAVWRDREQLELPEE